MVLRIGFAAGEPPAPVGIWCIIPELLLLYLWLCVRNGEAVAGDVFAGLWCFLGMLAATAFAIPVYCWRYTSDFDEWRLAESWGATCCGLATMYLCAWLMSPAAQELGGAEGVPD